MSSHTDFFCLCDRESEERFEFSGAEQTMKMKKRLIEGLTLGFLWTDRAILSDAIAWLQGISERFLA